MPEQQNPEQAGTPQQPTPEAVIADRIIQKHECATREQIRAAYIVSTDAVTALRDAGYRLDGQAETPPIEYGFQIASVRHVECGEAFAEEPWTLDRATQAARDYESNFPGATTQLVQRNRQTAWLPVEEKETDNND